MNLKQLIVLCAGAFLLALEVLYVPIRIFHRAGFGLIIRVEGLRYEWLPSLPANTVVQTDLITVEIIATTLLAGILYWVFSTREVPEWLRAYLP